MAFVAQPARAGRSVTRSAECLCGGGHAAAGASRPRRRRRRGAAGVACAAVQQAAAAAAATSSTDGPLTLTRHLIDRQFSRRDSCDESPIDCLGGPMEAAHQFDLLMSIAYGCKQVRALVQRAAITALDCDEPISRVVRRQANDALKNAVRHTGRLGVLFSGDEQRPLLVDETFYGDYVCVFTALDGAHSLDAGVPPGTLFGVFRRNLSCLASDWEARVDQHKIACLQTTLQPAASMLAAGYCVYAAETQLVLATDASGVDVFTYDADVGEFVLRRSRLTVPRRGSMISYRQAERPIWHPAVSEAVRRTLEHTSATHAARQRLELCDSSSLVADAHRTLLHGGVLIRPGDVFDQENGTLYLLHQCAPLAFVFECAGGAASDGRRRLADIMPSSLQQTSELFLGSRDDVHDVETVLRNLR